MPIFQNTAQPLNLQTQAALMLLCGLLYFYAFQLNVYWFEWLEFSYGANWVFLPSGFRLLLVLVFAMAGSLGITLSSMVINYSFDPEAHVFNMVTSLISGFGPYLARHLAIRWFQLDTQLHNLSGRVFFQLSVLFALVSALAHQLWFFWNNKTTNFVASTVAMGVGDWLGTVLVLASASLCIRAYKRTLRKPTGP